MLSADRVESLNKNTRPSTRLNCNGWGAFPEGRKFSVDYLLDIWAYVREMEWDDAFMVLLELTKKNILNLTSDPGYGICLHLLLSLKLLIASPVFIYIFFN